MTWWRRADGRIGRMAVAVGLAGVLTLEVTAIAAIVAAEHRAQRVDDARISVFQRAGAAWKKATVDVHSAAGPIQHGRSRTRAGRQQLVEPILRPTTVAASQASLRPDELVIGVEVGGVARAYRFAGFELKSGHLVNDVVGGVPVSVAYCDLTECLRVYTDPLVHEPLDLQVAGVLSGEMVVRHAGKMYFQKSGQQVEPGNGLASLAYQLINPTMTTWKEWVEQHPDTRVYVGKARMPRTSRR